MRRFIASASVALFVVVLVYGQSTSNRTPLVGAWKVTEIADGNGAPITNPQPGLYIFAGQHYSFARINGTKPLPASDANVLRLARFGVCALISAAQAAS